VEKIKKNVKKRKTRGLNKKRKKTFITSMLLIRCFAGLAVGQYAEQIQARI